MKSSLLPVLLLFVLCLFITCKKDHFPEKTNNLHLQQGFKQYSWSDSEKDFFSLIKREGIASDRSKNTGIFHPMLVSAYNEIAKQNETSGFVDGIVERVGLPHWSESFIYFNSTNKDNLVLIPLSYKSQTKVSAFILVTRKNNEPNRPFIINAISRQELMDTTTGDARQKIAYADWMIRYDLLLFNATEARLSKSYCHYKELIENPRFSPPPPPTTCVWSLIEICWNTLTNSSWIGESPINRLIDGDYDGDGIPNRDDPDWEEMIRKFGDCDTMGHPITLTLIGLRCL